MPEAILRLDLIDITLSCLIDQEWSVSACQLLETCRGSERRCGGDLPPYADGVANHNVSLCSYRCSPLGIFLSS